MCEMCKRYGKRLQLSPINDRELKVWNRCHKYLGKALGLKAFRLWHLYCVK